MDVRNYAEKKKTKFINNLYHSRNDEKKLISYTRSGIKCGINLFLKFIIVKDTLEI